MFQYTMWMLLHPTHLVLLSAILSNEIFCGSLFLIQNHVVCVPATTAKNEFYSVTTETEKL